LTIKAILWQDDEVEEWCHGVTTSWGKSRGRAGL